jgi:hypothetical protein
MEQCIVQFATLLFHDDVESVVAVVRAVNDPESFMKDHGTQLGYVFRPNRTIPKFQPWEVLIDVARLRNWVGEFDWKASPDEIITGVYAIRPAAHFPIDWDAIESGAEMETDKFLPFMGDRVREAGACLVSLDRGSDSYPLTVFGAGVVLEAQRLAAQIGDGRVDVYLDKRSIEENKDCN